ncbi:aminoacyl-histidine dipeptidase [Wohlfahrtiimonas chitiniclastica]|uniref:aminoacyl-histidine dipeptidase n=1 Tax=Wohlfahrtiimonas chitiniclastica TaxID=400946 RepID=UPI001BCC723D|nr:aminoacyl-histidine dipeptidase [Wohlfahrtiimonas chitiniclastica]MBS7833684.1 aminoacyl-histidine dipeptidase [Wohlfahrtiimonas chitiniclastica]MBS7835364.1 aminoacyl-histidine dipeptidase [Wohlfahrtiimonas chitiniclastica]
MSDILKLSPALVWKHFYEMNQIPRPSKKEDRIQAHFKAQAEQRGLEVLQDAIGNLIIRKPATPGYENAPPVIIQGHTDMVCQKNDGTEHDFDNDPIDMYIEGDWVRARGTTLGADNGVGVAMGMAILDDPEAEHGPLEIFLTVDEEAGMGGVRALQPNWLQGKYLINLDSEKIGKCVVGCAGGVDITYSAPLDYDDATYGHFIKVTLKGLRGGHSGADIHKGRESANNLLAECLSALSHTMPIRLVSFVGGTLRNALTREATAIFAYDETHTDHLVQHLTEWQTHLTQRLHAIDEGVTLLHEKAAAAPSLSSQDSHHVLSFLTLLPQGVLKRSAELPVVETSCNIGTVSIEERTGLNVGLLGRFLTPEGAEHLKIKTRNLGELAGYFWQAKNEYPAWTPNLDSKPLHLVQKIYEEKHGQPIRVEVIHAGLETGLIGRVYPEIEMVSFGPTITGAHSPDEQVFIPDVAEVYELTKSLLKALKD